jgi:hypothetical protein
MVILSLALVLLSCTRNDEHAMSPRSGVTGILMRHESLSSRFVDARNVDVWLPPSYGQDDTTRFPVVYMHDGQNLFDPELSFIGVDWGINETMTDTQVLLRLWDGNQGRNV